MKRFFISLYSGSYEKSSILDDAWSIAYQVAIRRVTRTSPIFSFSYKTICQPRLRISNTAEFTPDFSKISHKPPKTVTQMTCDIRKANNFGSCIPASFLLLQQECYKSFRNGVASRYSNEPSWLSNYMSSALSKLGSRGHNSSSHLAQDLNKSSRANPNSGREQARVPFHH